MVTLEIIASIFKIVKQNIIFDLSEGLMVMLNPYQKTKAESRTSARSRVLGHWDEVGTYLSRTRVLITDSKDSLLLNINNLY